MVRLVLGGIFCVITRPSHEARPGQPYPPSHSSRIPLKERTPAANTDGAELGLKGKEGTTRTAAPQQWWPTSKSPSSTAHSRPSCSAEC
ncbi:hypothetical protein MTO96_030599 [Rhipicephalus appendiculatus]